MLMLMIYHLLYRITYERKKRYLNNRDYTTTFATQMKQGQQCNNQKRTFHLLPTEQFGWLQWRVNSKQ